MQLAAVLIPLASAALLATCLGARAQALPDAAGDSALLPDIPVVAAMPRYPLRLDQARAVRGVYRLSNGWMLKVTPNWRQVIAEIDQHGPVALVALSSDRFVSADGRMAMAFNLGVQGDEMVLRYIPDSASAQVLTVTTRMAQR